VGSIPTWGILICLALGNALQILSPVFTGALTGLAQLVEHEAFNLRVAGSTPAIGIFCHSVNYKKYPLLPTLVGNFGIFFRYTIT
jgi:hypothetical protein